MQTAADVIVKGLKDSQMLLNRFTADLKGEDFLHRPTANANCCAWTIGHLILTERRCLGAFNIADLPALPDGFEKRYSRDEGCPQANEFSDAAALMTLFDQHRNRLIDAVENATPQQLDNPLEKPHPMFANAGEMAGFMTLHTTMHAGQISTIRRSLGRPPLM